MELRKKDQLEKYDNQLGKIQQEKLQIKNRLAELDVLEVDILSNRRDAGIRKYMNQEKRKRLLDEAERLGFSHEGIEILRDYSEDWNQDKISNEIIDEFENLEKYIKRQAPHKTNILYRFGGVANLNGGNENVN